MYQHLKNEKRNELNTYTRCEKIRRKNIIDCAECRNIGMIMDNGVERCGHRICATYEIETTFRFDKNWIVRRIDTSPFSLLVSLFFAFVDRRVFAATNGVKGRRQSAIDFEEENSPGLSSIFDRLIISYTLIIRQLDIFHQIHFHRVNEPTILERFPKLQIKTNEQNGGYKFFDSKKKKREKVSKRLAWKEKIFRNFSPLLFCLFLLHEQDGVNCRAIYFSEQINGRIGVYRNVFDVAVEYKQRCYRYEWPLDRSKDRFHPLPPRHFSPRGSCAVLSTPTLTTRNILASRNNGYERTTRSNYAQTKNNSTFYPRMKLLRNFYHEYFYHYFETLNFDLIKTARAIHGGLIRFQLIIIKPDTIAAHRVVSRVDFITTINNDNKH